MTDPRFTDDPRLSDPVVRRDESVGGIWGWIAGIALLLLIGFVIVAPSGIVGLWQKWVSRSSKA